MAGTIGECPPVRGLDLFDCADRGKIVLVFLRLGAFAQGQRIVDDEIECRNIDRRGRPRYLTLCSKPWSEI